MPADGMTSTGRERQWERTDGLWHEPGGESYNLGDRGECEYDAHGYAYISDKTMTSTALTSTSDPRVGYLHWHPPPLLPSERCRCPLCHVGTHIRLLLVNMSGYSWSAWGGIVVELRSCECASFLCFRCHCKLNSSSFVSHVVQPWSTRETKPSTGEMTGKTVA